MLANFYIILCLIIYEGGEQICFSDFVDLPWDCSSWDIHSSSQVLVETPRIPRRPTMMKRMLWPTATLSSMLCSCWLQSTSWWPSPNGTSEYPCDSFPSFPLNLHSWHSLFDRPDTREHFSYNEPAMWIKIASSWVCLLIYGWTLIAPMVLTDREF